MVRPRIAPPPGPPARPARGPLEVAKNNLFATFTMPPKTFKKLPGAPPKKLTTNRINNVHRKKILKQIKPKHGELPAARGRAGRAGPGAGNGGPGHFFIFCCFFL